MVGFQRLPKAQVCSQLSYVPNTYHKLMVLKDVHSAVHAVGHPLVPQRHNSRVSLGVQALSTLSW